MTSDVPTTPMDRADGPGGPSTPSGPVLPGLAEGTELAGEFVGAGYKEPPLLVYRGDGQVVRLPELLYQTVRALDDCRRLGDPAAGRRPFTDRNRLLAVVAEHLSAQAGREYAAGHVEFLLDNKLAPLGVTTRSDGTPPELVKPQPMLSLTCRMTMLSERSTWFLAGLFTWLFSLPALAAMIPLILGAASWALITQPIAAAVEVTIASPASILIVVALAIASTGFHEIGHGTACRYGGVRPGVTGCGFYLAWPVFFTDITNTYRMGRGGRLRADLGGVYFNGVFLLLLTVGYVASGRPAVLLVAILSTSLEAVQQLLPTLRFDGYYIIADMVGIPDLFKYIGPIIRRVLLRRPDDGRLAALKRWPQTVVTIWVLLVVPVLLGQLSLLAYNFPGIVRSDWTGVHVLASRSLTGSDPVLGVAAAVAQILLLLFPLVGMVLIALRLIRGLIRLLARRLHTAGLVDLTALAGVWGIAWFLGIGGARDAGGVTESRRRRRPGMMPVIGAAAVLGLAVIMAWTLTPSSREGNAADLRPNKIVGAPAASRTAHPGRPRPAPESPRSSRFPAGTAPSPGYPAGTGYPGKGEGQSPYPAYSPAGSDNTGSGNTGSDGPGATGAGTSPAETGTPSSGTSSAAASAPSSGVTPSGTTSAGIAPAAPVQSQPAQSQPAQSQPAQSQPAQSQPSPAQSPAAPSSSAQWSPEATGPSAGPASGQPSGPSGGGSQAPSPGNSQPASPSPPGSGSPSVPPSVSPSAPGTPSGSPSGSPSPSGSQSPSPQASQPSGNGSAPSLGGSSPAAPPGGTQPGAPQAACQVPVGGMLLTLIGLCSH